MAKSQAVATMDIDNQADLSEDLSILNGVPSQKLLKNLVVSRIAYMWHNIGVQLGMSLNDLAKIDQNYKREPVDECCNKMLISWRSKNIEVSGEKLTDAIENNDNANYAAELREEIVKLGEDATILSDAYTQENIVPRIATEWDDIALDLGIKDFEIGKIRQICDLSKKKCTDMLLLWLKNGPRTWRNIYDAMQRLDLNKPAEDLKDDLLIEADKQDSKQSTVPN